MALGAVLTGAMVEVEWSRRKVAYESGTAKLLDHLAAATEINADVWRGIRKSPNRGNTYHQFAAVDFEFRIAARLFGKLRPSAEYRDFHWELDSFIYGCRRNATVLGVLVSEGIPVEISSEFQRAEQLCDDQKVLVRTFETLRGDAVPR